MDDSLNQTNLGAVPLFPLPNVVLFPRAILPLHIFEERYKTMTADALAGDRQIAIALLEPGWEKDYYQRPPIEPVVCVGRILSHELLADGKYNFLLQGLGRAIVVREARKQGYRIAELRPLKEVRMPEDELDVCRRRMLELLSQPPLSQSPGARQFREMLDSEMPTADIADLLAFTYLDDVPLKQSLLAEADVGHRVCRIIGAIHNLWAQLAQQSSAHGSSPYGGLGKNPSMN
jgi:Lon protease-like protein